MGPKAKASANLDASALPGVAAPLLPQANSSQAAAINAKYAADLQAATAAMTEHHAFVDVAKDKPLHISQAPFSSAAFKSSMQGSKVYRCAGNAFWINIVTSTSVPIREKKVAKVKHEYFQVPTDIFPSVLCVGMVESELQQTGYTIPAANLGKLDMISPDEILHALIFRIAEDIQKGAPEDDLQKWRTCLLNAPMEFKVIILSNTFLISKQMNK